MAAKKNIYLIDGSGYIYRAYYAIRPLSTRDGTPTNAVIGFAKMLGKLLRQEKPEHLGITFDPKGPTFRHERYSAYKENRESMPEDLRPQAGLIRELVEAMDIPRLEVKGYEADDILATLTKQALAAGYHVTIVSADKDLMQLIGDGVTMFDPMKGKVYAPDDVVEKFGVGPEWIADVLALAGDSSDNIPGVPKVGVKTAAKLINRFGDVEAVIAGLSTVEKLKAAERSVIENADLARLSKTLTVLADDAPISLDTDAIVYTRPDPEKLGPFLQRLEAFNLMRELGVEAKSVEAKSQGPSKPVSAQGQGELGLNVPSNNDPSAPNVSVSAPATGGSTVEPVALSRASYGLLLDDAALAPFKQSKRLGLFVADSSRQPLDSEWVGVGLCRQPGQVGFVPLALRYLGAPQTFDRTEFDAWLASWLADSGNTLVVYDAKHFLSLCLVKGWKVACKIEDPMLAAYVLDPSRASFGIEAVARDVLVEPLVGEKEIRGTGKSQIGLDQVDVATLVPFGSERAEIAWHLCEAYGPQLAAQGLTSLYRDLELPLTSVLAAMERRGIAVDLKALDLIAREFTQRLAKIEVRAHELAGETVNLASPKQLGELFFQRLGYPVIKKTKTGYSTNHEVLETLGVDHELPRVILEHRGLSKLKSTYLDALAKLSRADTGRVHTTYNATGAATGRLSSVEPNLQNIPIRTADGRRIRDTFVPREGWVLVSADYSQIELRVMAHFSKDERFIDAFKRGADIHQRTAEEILTDGAPADAEARRRAKAINFGILYGLSEFGLSRQLGIPRKEASQYIAKYFSRYPGIRRFLDEVIEEARSSGFVTTLLGRRRYLPQINSKNGNLRQAAERVAMNTPIQGTAADLIKRAMLRVDGALVAGRFESQLLLQVHDELVLESPPGEVERVSQMLRDEMSAVAVLEVPLVVDVGNGPNWGAAH